MSELRSVDFEGVDFLGELQALRRPRLLIRAARIGVTEYRRDRDLRKLVGAAGMGGPARTLPALLAEEDRLETLRLAGDASYSVTRHVGVMIALLGEARLLPRPAMALALAVSDEGVGL